MLIDDVTITITAGSGGRGAVAFNDNVKSLGPTGGTGGNGGNVYLEGVPDIMALYQFRNKKVWVTEDGGNGKRQFNDGADAPDLFLKIPVGTVVHNLTTGTDREILKAGERILIAKGGHGGKGNFHFRSSRNTSPKEFQEGLPGEKFELRLELKLIADVGIIGLPNAGKSSLLNELTNARSKVGNYSFTTLTPNLGMYERLIIADIPGLIEGASRGKGLGDKFLRHIERTRVLFHVISAESPAPREDYETVRKELGDYNPALLEKAEYLFVSKSDAVSKTELNKKIAILKKLNPSVSPVSIYDPESIEYVKQCLVRAVK